MLPPFSHPIALAVSLPRGEFLTLETLRGTANYNVVRYFKRDAMPREVLPHGQPGILIAAEGTPETIRWASSANPAGNSSLRTVS